MVGPTPRNEVVVRLRLHEIGNQISHRLCRRNPEPARLHVDRIRLLLDLGRLQIVTLEVRLGPDFGRVVDLCVDRGGLREAVYSNIVIHQERYDARHGRGHEVADGAAGRACRRPPQPDRHILERIAQLGILVRHPDGLVAAVTELVVQDDVTGACMPLTDGRHSRGRGERTDFLTALGRHFQDRA